MAGAVFNLNGHGGTVFSLGQKGCTFNRTTLSSSSIQGLPLKSGDYLCDL
jgi:hypothetical protein